jgi:hypothetical protein
MNYVKTILLLLLLKYNLCAYLRTVDDIFNDDDSFNEDLVAIANNKHSVQYKNKENIFSLSKSPIYVDYIPIVKHNKYNKKYYYENNKYSYETNSSHPLKSCIKEGVKQSKKYGAVAITSFNISKINEYNHICNGIFIHSY